MELFDTRFVIELGALAGAILTILRLYKSVEDTRKASEDRARNDAAWRKEIDLKLGLHGTELHEVKTDTKEIYSKINSMSDRIARMEGDRK